MFRYLDRLSPVCSQNAWGSMGVRGRLGYANAWVTANGRHYQHAVSSHAPSTLEYEMPEGTQHFRCHVALNDSSGEDVQSDFCVYADDKLVAAAANVRRGDPPRSLFANLDGARMLRLETRSASRAYAHTIWIDPMLSDVRKTTLDAPFGQARIHLPPVTEECETCLFAVITRDYAPLLEDALESLYANGGCKDARLVVFGYDLDERCENLLRRHNALFVRCDERGGKGLVLKAAAFSIAHVVRAKRYLFFDADLIFLDEVTPLFTALDVSGRRAVLIGIEQNNFGDPTLSHAFSGWYHAEQVDFERLRMTPEETCYPIVVNSGLFVANHEAMLAADTALRAMMPACAVWENEKKPAIWWREQALFNLALARIGVGTVISNTYNYQLLLNEATVSVEGGHPRAISPSGETIRVLHFNGPHIKKKYPEIKGIYHLLSEMRFGISA